MNEVTKQTVLDLLDAAKTHIAAGETALATEKIDAAIAAIENEGVETTSDGEEGKIPPLAGTGSNGSP